MNNSPTSAATHSESISSSQKKGLPLRFHPARLRTLVILPFLALTIIWWLYYASFSDPVLYFWTLIFALMFVSATLLWLPGWSELTLTSTGFSRRASFKRLPEKPWDDFENFGAAFLYPSWLRPFFLWEGYTKRLTLTYSDHYRSRMRDSLSPEQFTRWEQNFASRKKRNGFNDMLPWPYNMRATRLAALMNELREEYKKAD